MRPIIFSSADRSMQPREYVYRVAVYHGWEMPGGWDDEYKRARATIERHYEDNKNGVRLFDFKTLNLVPERPNMAGFTFKSNADISGELKALLAESQNEVFCIEPEQKPAAAFNSKVPDLKRLQGQKPNLRRRAKPKI